jgi:hypothetical protein
MKLLLYKFSREGVAQQVGWAKQPNTINHLIYSLIQVFLLGCTFV